MAISITTLGETTCCCLNTRDLRIATQQMRVFATSLLWTSSHMHPSNRALYSFYLHLERERSSRWDKNCQRNSAADEKLFITSHGGEGVYNFRRGLDLGVNFENPQNVIGVEILRHGTGIPCKCCQTTFCLKAKTKISPVQNYCAHCTGLQVPNPRGYPLCILLVAAPEFRQR